MTAILTWLAGVVQSTDGRTGSATRVCGVLVVLAFIVNMFWKTDVGALGLAAALATTLFGVRDGGPLDSYFQAKASIAASTAGVTTPVLPGSS